MRFSAAIEDYVREIYDLGRDDEAVATTALAERLEVAPASVTGMLKRLDTLGLVEHTPYAGVRLTPLGRKVALEVIRHHRLIETYLAEAMGVAWDRVHDEAHRLEHHISEELEDRMAELLGHPEFDPHGAPIPPKEGDFREPTFRALDSAAEGERLAVREVPDEDSERLRYFASVGLMPGAEFEVLEVAPFDGPITIRIGGRSLAIGRAMAETILVERTA
jgi:DtxR family Mn-dependent transcriptional regulator